MDPLLDPLLACMDGLVLCCVIQYLYGLICLFFVWIYCFSIRCLLVWIHHLYGWIRCKGTSGAHRHRGKRHRWTESLASALMFFFSFLFEMGITTRWATDSETSGLSLSFTSHRHFEIQWWKLVWNRSECKFQSISLEKEKKKREGVTTPFPSFTRVRSPLQLTAI